jgi:AcrR family transcriptional regulator
MPITQISSRAIGPRTRKTQLVAAAASLFAERGFHGVTIEELGMAVGISGPGVYKHFASKDAVLAEMLVDISQYLLREGRNEVAAAFSPDEALNRLLAFHTNFALTSPNLIRVQDRDLANLSSGEARKVRSLQRAYVELWVRVLTARDSSLADDEARTRAHAVFGLLNSTPHSAATRDTNAVGSTLMRMARGALAVDHSS